MIILEIFLLALLIVVVACGGLLAIQFFVFLAFKAQFGDEEGERLFGTYSKNLNAAMNNKEDDDG
jgi:hypothetical protein